jgi:hypothetical protein
MQEVRGWGIAPVDHQMPPGATAAIPAGFAKKGIKHQQTAKNSRKID